MHFSTSSSLLMVISLATAAACVPGGSWYPKPSPPWGPPSPPPPPVGGPPGGPGGPGGCLTQASATSIVNQYATLLTNPGGPNFNQTANTLLANDFAVYSDSINILAGRPLGGPSFPSKAIFIASQAQTPPIPVLTTDEIFFNCNKIAWRWTGSGIGSNVDESKGIITINVSPQGQIDTVYSEFNTAAWYADLGYPECQAQSGAPPS